MRVCVCVCVCVCVDNCYATVTTADAQPSVATASKYMQGVDTFLTSSRAPTRLFAKLGAAAEGGGGGRSC